MPPNPSPREPVASLRARTVTSRVRQWDRLLVVAIPEDVAREQGILPGDLVELRLLKRRREERTSAVVS